MKSVNRLWKSMWIYAIVIHLSRSIKICRKPKSIKSEIMKNLSQFANQWNLWNRFKQCGICSNIWAHANRILLRIICWKCGKPPMKSQQIDWSMCKEIYVQVVVPITLGWHCWRGQPMLTISRRMRNGGRVTGGPGRGLVYVHIYVFGRLCKCEGHGT